MIWLDAEIKETGGERRLWGGQCVMIRHCQLDFSVSSSKNMSESTWKWVGWGWVCAAPIFPGNLWSFPHKTWEMGVMVVCVYNRGSLANVRVQGRHGGKGGTTKALSEEPESLGMSLRNHRCGTRRTREASFSLGIFLKLCICREK